MKKTQREILMMELEVARKATMKFSLLFLFSMLINMDFMRDN
jgi:hypothetical protein